MSEFNRSGTIHFTREKVESVRFLELSAKFVRNKVWHELFTITTKKDCIKKKLSATKEFLKTS